jgi:phage anti-repressor protein/predicted GIY-YIG superfamily endonuclease
MDLKEFLKKYSTISNYFIDEFLGFYSLETLNNEFIVDLEKIALWLNSRKSTLKETLIKSYQKNIDYKVIKAIKAPNSGSGGATKQNIFLTVEAFKKLCMLSRTKRGEEVRKYFLELENLINKYKNYIIKELNGRINVLENNQKPIVETKKGTIYIIRATDDANDSLYKIGKTENLKKRVKAYNTGKADNVEVLFHYEVDDITTLEKCVKLQMKKYQYRKYKEVFQINLDILKQVIKKCDEFEVIFKKENMTIKQLGGNLYLLFDNIEEPDDGFKVAKIKK